MSGMCKYNFCLREYGQKCLASLLLLLMLVACGQNTVETAVSVPVDLTIIADGETQTVSSEADTVRVVLEEVSIPLAAADEIEPPLFTPVTDGMTIRIIRISDSLEIVERSIPFDRKIVRNESMNADDPDVIIQAGKAGLQEETVRIVYRDGLETDRWVTQVTIVEPAQDEIVMTGIGAGRSNINFEGSLAYISDGTAVILRGLTAFPEQLNTGDGLDGRVFSLSPDGSHLLYTRVLTDSVSFNNGLWVVRTERGAQPHALGVDNVLWADWDPSSPMAIAYTTAIATNLPPGWEANNDLWLGDVKETAVSDFEPEQIIEAYPATYGWWGGNFAWSPEGRIIAYSYADEVGLIDTEADEDEENRLKLQSFTEYNTLTDWVWVPTLAWSPNGRYLAFTNHNNPDPEALQFDSWIVDTENGVAAQFIDRVGMWGHLNWSPAGEEVDEIFYLQAVDVQDSLRSAYTLWVMDQDGSNGRQLYPPTNEISYFSIAPDFMAWSPNGRQFTFIYDDALYLFDLENETAQRINQDDATIGSPSWSPYGVGLDDPFVPTDDVDIPIGSDRFTP